MISRVKNVFIQSASAGDLRGFYEALLGQDPQFVDNDRWVQFRVGDVAIALAGGTECVTPERMGWCVTFQVPDLDQALDCVISLGGRVQQRRDTAGHGRTAVVVDPSGNVLVLWQ